jgi:hypothetical protein
VKIKTNKTKTKLPSPPPIQEASEQDGLALLWKMETINRLIAEVLNDLRSQTFSPRMAEDARDFTCVIDGDEGRDLDEVAREIIALIQEQYERE